MSSSTVYWDNIIATVVVTSPRINMISNHISVKYHWFSRPIGKEFVIKNIESKNPKADFSTKTLQGYFSLSLSKTVFNVPKACL